MILLPAVLVVAGVVLLYLGAEWLVRGATHISAVAGVSPVVVGLTVVSVGTSAPELVVCVLAALEGSPDLAVGNVLGSNLANVGLILGLVAVIRPMEVAGGVIRRDIPWMLLVTMMVLPLMLDLEVGRLDGFILAVVLSLYLVYLARVWRRQSPQVLGEAARRLEPIPGAPAAPSRGGMVRPIALVVVGSLMLMGGGHLVVTGATDIAELLGVGQLTIGLSVVAVGTSLPELAATLVAVGRKEADLAVGNIVGSNLFNLTLVLGGTALVSPIAIPERVLLVEYPAVLLLSLVLLPLAFSQRRITRIEGAFLLCLYAGAWFWIANSMPVF